MMINFLQNHETVEKSILTVKTLSLAMAVVLLMLALVTVVLC